MACEECGTEFDPTRSWQKYCGERCKQHAESRRYREAHHDQKLAATKAWRAANRDKVLAYAAAYRLANADRIKAARKLIRATKPDQEPEQQRAAYWRDPDKARKRRKDRYWADPDRAAALHKSRYDANPEYFRKRSRDYYQLNLEGRREYNRRYREANSDKRNAWQKANPEKVRAYGQERRARKLGKPVDHIDIIAVFDRDNWTCQLCFEPVDPSIPRTKAQGASLDHIIPLNHPEYPGHLWTNVQLAHMGCNSRKRDRVQ